MVATPQRGYAPTVTRRYRPDRAALVGWLLLISFWVVALAAAVVAMVAVVVIMIVAAFSAPTYPPLPDADAVPATADRGEVASHKVASRIPAHHAS